MKVKIGKYPRWFGPYQAVRFLKYFGVSADDRCEISQKISSKPFTWFYNTFQNRGRRKVYVRVDEEDCWSADATLAEIILPVLIKLSTIKHGVSWVDHADVPKEIHKTEEDFKGNEYSWSEKGCYAQEYWTYVLDEMIWAFHSILHEDDYEDAWHIWNEDHTELIRFDAEKHKQYMERQQNGLRLFGKYYRSLWD